MRTSSRLSVKFIALAIAIYLGSFAARTGSAQDAEQPNRYEVELIVFRHVDQSRNTPETDAPRRLVFSDVPSDLVLPEADSVTIENEREAMNDIRNAFVPLNRDQLKLTDTYERLLQVDAYAPLLHTGWAQEARSTGEALPNRLTSAPNRTAPLSGSVTLYKQRFLHLNIDLALSNSTVSNPTEPVIFSDRPVSPESAVARLQESRRIRNEDVNYFDHPQIGVIVTVREIETDVTESSTDNETG